MIIIISSLSELMPGTLYRQLSDRADLLGGIAVEVEDWAHADLAECPLDLVQSVLGLPIKDGKPDMSGYNAPWETATDPNADVIARAERVVGEMLDLAENHSAITSRVLKASTVKEQVQGLLSADGAIVEVKPLGDWRAE